MGDKVVVDSEDLMELRDLMEAGKWEQAMVIVQQLADFSTRRSIRIMQERNYKMYKAGTIPKAEYERNRQIIRDFKRDHIGR